MGKIFNQKDTILSNVLYGLSDPVRLQIARSLYKAKKPLTCTQAVEGIPNLPISTRSHCFKLLRESGVIRSDRRGRECYNSLRLQEIETSFPGVLPSILK